jgi:hypothetical protein
LEHRKRLLKIDRIGNFIGQKIGYVEALGIAQRPKEIRIDGREAARVEFDATRKRLRIPINDHAKEISIAF